MNKLILRNASVYKDRAFSSADVLCVDGKIAAIGRDLRAKDAEVFDCGGLRLAPGFIDAHTHGAFGLDVNAAAKDDLLGIGAFFASQGVTSWQASVLTDTEAQTLWCLRQIKAAMQEAGKGARLFGAHLEGPFLAPEYKGAMPESLLRKGDAALLGRYRQAAPGAIRYLTVSPEVEGVPEMIAQVAGDVVVAIGHSGADYDTSIEGTHYASVSDNLLDPYATGYTAENHPYNLTIGWQFGCVFNQKWVNSYPEDVEAQYAAYNDAAVKAPYMGYTFNGENVSSEQAALSNVIEQYFKPLSMGMVDPATGIPQFLDALKANGIDRVIEEANTQLTAFIEAK